MKRLAQVVLTAGLMALAILSLKPAAAQNNRNSYDSYGMNGYPGFTLNAPGSNYGAIYNDTSTNSGNSWSLGYGASQSNGFTPALTWDATKLVTATNLTLNTSLTPPVKSTATIRGAVGSYAPRAVGDIVIATLDSTGAFFAVCVATAASAGSVVLASSTASGCWK